MGEDEAILTFTYFSDGLVQHHQLDTKKRPGTRSEKRYQRLAAEQMMPSTLRWLREIRADAVFCDPMWNLDVMFAAKVAKIPCLGLLTFAGGKQKSTKNCACTKMVGVL